MSAIDIIIWIVILGVVAAGIVIAIHYSSDISTASNVHSEVQNTAALVSQIRQAWAGYSDYATITDTGGKNLTNVFGDAITLAPDTTNSNAFDLTDQVPNSACTAIANAVLKDVTGLTINGTAVALPVTDPAAIGTACGTTDPVTITEVYSGM